MLTQNFKKKKILLVGPYPPPYGGVGNHIKRLSALLKNDFDITIVDESKNRRASIFNVRSLKLVAYMRLIMKSDVIHIHSGHYILRLMHFITSKIFRKTLSAQYILMLKKIKGFLKDILIDLFLRDQKK